MESNLKEAKKALRATVLAARAAMPANVRQSASATAIERVRALPAYRNARSVMTYMSFDTELDTHDFFSGLLRDGKMAALPRIDRTSKQLSVHCVSSPADLVAGVWGIQEPRADLPVVPINDIDMVLMPGVAFDRQGNRLGYGAGFYDRLLSTAGTRPVRVVAAFDEQVVDAVPHDDTDQRIHILVTPTQILEFPETAT
ncbi:MAG: 5-formyltetrahydrofolate cyclo-ligase [Betaproteobacteria bacterium]|nr:5-formyltetrahydrofolate cyclo-ligase [Betaproteobacteria bacterium]